jgi:hypothetical protein
MHKQAHAFSRGCPTEEFHDRGAFGTFANGPVSGTDETNAAFPAFRGHHPALRFGLLQAFAPLKAGFRVDAQSLDTVKR